MSPKPWPFGDTPSLTPLSLTKNRPSPNHFPLNCLQLSDPDRDLLKEVPELDSEEDDASSSDDVELEESVESDPVEPETEESELEEDDEDEVSSLVSFSSPLVTITGGFSKSESSTEPVSDSAPYW